MKTRYLLQEIRDHPDLICRLQEKHYQWETEVVPTST